MQEVVDKAKVSRKRRRAKRYSKGSQSSKLDRVLDEMITLDEMINECVEALFPTPEPVDDTDATDATNVPTTFDVTKPEDITLTQ